MKPYFGLLLNWAFAAVLLVAAYFVCYRIPLSGMAADPSLMRLHVIARTIGIFLLVLSGLSAVLLVSVSIASLRHPDVPGSYLVWIAFLSASPFIGYVVVALLTWPMHRHALDDLAQRGAGLAAAIDAYTHDHGEAPSSLDAVHVSPATGLAAYPEFAYRRFSTADSRRTLYWYDLGRRHGRSVTSDWLYPDGDTARALLAVEVDGEGNVASVKADRMAVDPKPASFSRDAWDATPIERQGMVADLLRAHPFVGASFAAMQETIGPPSGERVLVDTPWELWTHTWPSERERFFYWPTHAYPTVMDGQSVLAVSGWGYVRD